MYANVLVEYNVKSLDKSFTYKIPSNLVDKIKPGMQVIVPFGKSICNGFVLNLTNEVNEDVEIKSIYKIKNEEIILNQELLDLGLFLKETTLCNLISAYEAMLPSDVKVKSKKVNNKYLTYIKIAVSLSKIEDYITDHARSKKQVSILNQLLEEEMVLKSSISGTSLNELLRIGLVKEELVQVYRINKDNKKKDLVKLNDYQMKVFDEVAFNEAKTYLLHGVTGSGKTEIYIKWIKKALALKKTALLLVPEITLTTQIVNRLYDVFGSDIAILHSGLSDGERQDEYLKILRKEVRVVVGTRSSVFAPLENIGVMIIDEEHSESYKQENNPKYDAIEVLKKRSINHQCPLILGSATPSLDSYARASKGVYQLLELNKRANDALLPIIHLVNMEEEYKNRNMIISSMLKEFMEERLNNHEQIILLLNRRGYSTILNCSNCGFAYKCPHCDINLTYHKTNNNLRCHYCGYTTFLKDKCPNCKSDAINDFGLGTEKLEKEVSKLFPSARIIRMDADTTTKKNSHDEIIKKFADYEYDILLGTQMISKGLDFPKVTLVGIINADQSLNMPDFKANERTFQLLHQASGRAGRSGNIGEVIIQTMNPTDYTLNCIKDNNYQMFYKHEMQIRKNLKYPPYYFLALVKIISKDYDTVLKESNKVYKYLIKNLSNVEILGPTTAPIFKINNKYTMQIIIKYRKVDNLYKVLKDLDDQYLLDKLTNIEIDTSPKSI